MPSGTPLFKTRQDQCRQPPCVRCGPGVSERKRHRDDQSLLYYGPHLIDKRCYFGVAPKLAGIPVVGSIEQVVAKVEDQWRIEVCLRKCRRLFMKGLSCPSGIEQFRVKPRGVVVLQAEEVHIADESTDHCGGNERVIADPGAFADHRVELG